MSYQGRYRTGLVGAGPTKKKWNPAWGNKAAKVVRGSQYKAIATPSVQQRAIFDNVEHDSSHLIVQALAGTGKTSTIVEAMRLVPQGKSILYVIFANRNAREAEGKCEERIEVKTIHALGLATLRKAYGKIEVDDKGDKSYAISLALLGPEDEKAELRYHFAKAMSLAKGYLCETPDDVVKVIDKHGVETCDMDVRDFASKVIEGLALSTKQYMRVEFDDMVYLPCKLNLAVPQYDLVCLDESQDASPARIELVLRAIKPTGKLVSIGDSHQAIYGFTGADEHAMQTIAERTHAHTLPLTKTYRCGKAIVALAQSYVPEYEAAETNPEGVVKEASVQDMMRPIEEGGAGPGCMILSRTNAPLVPLCLQFIRESRKATVLGKDLGKNLLYMIKRSGAESVVGFLAWLDEWKNIECEKLIERNKSCDHIVDKYDTLVALADGLRDLAAMRQRITDMFSDDNVENIITLSTAHKSKGLERRRVYLLLETFAKCAAKAKQPFEVEQENNLMYVSITRAIEELYQVV